MIGRLLQIGVLLSAVIVLIGGILYFVQAGKALPDYRNFEPGRAPFTGFAAIAQGVWRFDARSIIALGLLLLIATPVARVAFSIFAFWAEGDRMYVVFTCIVFIVLLYSLSGWQP
jgi:uncharacterized membrane protein